MLVDPTRTYPVAILGVVLAQVLAVGCEHHPASSPGANEAERKVLAPARSPVSAEAKPVRATNALPATWKRQWATGGRLGEPPLSANTLAGRAEFSPDGRWLVTLSDWDYEGGYTVDGPHVWDVQSGRMVWNGLDDELAEVGGGPPATIDIGPSSRRLLVQHVRRAGSPDGAGSRVDVDVYELSGAKHLAHVAVPHGTQMTRITPGGDTIVAAVVANASAAHRVRLEWYDIHTGKKKRTAAIDLAAMGVSGKSTAHVVLSASARALAVFAGDRVAVYSLPTPKKQWAASVDQIDHVEFSPDESHLAVYGRQVRVIDLAAGKTTATLELCAAGKDVRASGGGKVGQALREKFAKWCGATDRDRVTPPRIEVDWSRPKHLHFLYFPRTSGPPRIVDLAARAQDTRFDSCPGAPSGGDPVASSTACAAGQVSALTFSPDGKRVAEFGQWPRLGDNGGNANGFARIFDAQSATQQQLVAGGGEPIEQLTVLGKRGALLSVSDEAYTGVRRWSLASGHLDAVFVAGGAYRVAVSASERRFATSGAAFSEASRSPTVRAWTLGHEKPVVSLSPKAPLAAAVWNGEEPRFLFPRDQERGQWTLVDARGHSVQEVTLPAGLRLRHDGARDGSLLVGEDDTGASDQLVVVRARDGKVVGRMPIAKGALDVEVSRDGSRLAALVATKWPQHDPARVRLIVWDVGHQKMLRQRSFTGEFVPTVVALGPNGRRVALADHGRVVMLDSELARRVDVARLDGPVTALAFAGADALVMGRADGRIERWNAQ